MQQLPRKPITLTLCHAAVLDHKEFEPFLHEDVTYLDISYRPQISLATVHQIQKRCINFKVLNISDCKELPQIEEGLFQSSYLHFPDLETLLINECLNLKSMKIRADQLQVLERTKNLLLSKIRLDTKNFPKITLESSSLADVEFVNLQTTCKTPADFAVAKERYFTRLAYISTYRR